MGIVLSLCFCEAKKTNAGVLVAGYTTYKCKKIIKKKSHCFSCLVSSNDWCCHGSNMFVKGSFPYLNKIYRLEKAF